jgi:hypothetical protein
MMLSVDYYLLRETAEQQQQHLGCVTFEFDSCSTKLPAAALLCNLNRIPGSLCKTLMETKNGPF